MQSLHLDLILAAALVSGCDRGGYSHNTSERYKIQKAEVGVSQQDGKDIATLVMYCGDHTFHFISSDSSKPSDIVERFKRVLPIAADFKAHGESSCQLVVTLLQYHSGTLNDNSNAPQKQAWFRFSPNTDLCQSFRVTNFAEGQPSNFTSGFAQDLEIPLIVEDKHWIQTKSKSPP